jgi:hypothetical protein
MNILLTLTGVDNIIEDSQRRYANFFFTAGTANTNPYPIFSNAPPSQIDTAKSSTLNCIKDTVQQRKSGCIRHGRVAERQHPS